MVFPNEGFLVWSFKNILQQFDCRVHSQSLDQKPQHHYGGLTLADKTGTGRQLRLWFKSVFMCFCLRLKARYYAVLHLLKLLGVILKTMPSKGV